MGSSFQRHLLAKRKVGFWENQREFGNCLKHSAQKCVTQMCVNWIAMSGQAQRTEIHYSSHLLSKRFSTQLRFTTVLVRFSLI